MYYTVTDYYDLIAEKNIVSQCPECKNRSCLSLLFYQKRIETPFFKKISKKISATLYCKHSQSEVAPVLWTDEISNYFETEKKKLQLKPTGLKFTKIFYFVLIVPFIAIVSFMGYDAWQHQQYTDQTKAIENITIGNKVGTMMNLLEHNRLTKSYTSWLLVQKIEGDTIWLQEHMQLSETNEDEFDLNDTNFSGKIYKASLSQLKQRTLTGFDHTQRKFTGYITAIEK